MEKFTNNSEFTNKKRKNSKEKSNFNETKDDDYKMYYDQSNVHLYKNENKEMKKDLQEIVDIDFLFSEIRNTYFFPIKNFLVELLEFNTFDASGLSDLILEEKGFLGTVVKTELEEETGNELPDLFNITTLIPYDFFPSVKCLNQIMSFCVKNIESCINKGNNKSLSGLDNNDFKKFLELMIKKGELNSNNSDLSNNNELLKSKEFDIVNKSKLGIFVNEKMSNFPPQLVGPLFNLLKTDIINFKEANEGEKGVDKYDFTHILYVTKCVKNQKHIDNNNSINNNGKKRFISTVDTNMSKKDNVDNYLFYKFEDYYFLKESDYNVIYKIPYKEKELENLENTNEPIHKVIMMITAEKYYKTVEWLLNNSQK